MTTSRFLSFGFTFLFTITSLSTLPAVAKTEPLTFKAVNQVKPQLVHRRHRAHRLHRHHWRHYHHHRHVPRLGLHIYRLPRGFFGITFGGSRFFVQGGVFYRPAGVRFVVVKAPYGAVVENLPQGYRVIQRGKDMFYHYNDIYYARNHSGPGYVVVAEPFG